MGSELFTYLKEQGRPIRRGGGETLVASPLEFTIIGLDITPEKIAALYPDESKAHTRARAIILGIRDKTRVSKPPPPAFVATFRKGCEEPITVANLGPDRKGRLWFVVCKGRNRTMALRAWNEANPAATWELAAYLKPFVHNDKAGIDAELDALESNAASNVFVAEAPSTKADRAQALGAKGKAPADIAITIGARGAAEVILLQTLAECHEAVRDAVDEGRIGLAAVADLAKHNHEEQARRVARKTAGPSKAGKDAAAKPREKARPAVYMTRLADALPERTYDRDEVRELLAHVAGGATAGWLVPAAAKAKGGAT